MGNEVEIRVKAHDDTATGFAAARRGISRLRDSFRSIGDRTKGIGSTIMQNIVQGVMKGAQQVQSTLHDVFSGGLKGALSSGPIGLIIVAALVAAIAAAAPAIATALAGALTLGIGAAFVGVGAFILLQNEKVQKKLADSWGKVSKILEKAFAPLLPVLDFLMSTLADLAKEFAPVIRSAMQLSQGPLKAFIGDLSRAFLELKPALEPLMEAFSALLSSIGPMLPAVFGSVSDALIELADAVTENKDVIMAIFIALLYTIPRVIDVTRVLTNIFGGSMRWLANTAVPWLIEAWNTLVAIWNGAVESIGNGVSNVRDFFSRLVDFIRGIPGRIAAIASRMFTSITRAASRIVDSARRVLLGIVSFVRSLPGRIAAAATGMFSGIVNAAKNAASQAISAISSIPSNIGSFLGFARGGIVGAAASGGPRGGTVLVGEQGPELVKLPYGSQVTAAGQTAAMLGNGGRASTVVLEINSGGSKLDDLLVELLRKAVRDRGGDVQVVLGKAR
jgi:phage-related protein